jgi:hypothetical protein
MIFWATLSILGSQHGKGKVVQEEFMFSGALFVFLFSLHIYLFKIIKQISSLSQICDKQLQVVLGGSMRFCRV